MKEVSFIKISPTQNMTLLIPDSVPRGEHHSVAAELMDYGHVYAEQVGYIETPEDSTAKSRLQMMGGEFCGNATMSLACYLVWQQKLPVGTVEQVLLEVSGADKLLNCTVTVEEKSLKGKVKMPSATSVTEETLLIGEKPVVCHKVEMPGIHHYIVPMEEVDISDQKTLEVVLEKLGAKAQGIDALGLMFYDEKNMTINPLVYVIPTKTLIWERGCGSGSASLGAYLSWGKETSHTHYIKQPGGTICVYTEPNGDLYIEGTVKIVATGTAYL